MFSSAYSSSSASLKKRKRERKAKAGQQKRLREESERLVRKITEGYEVYEAVNKRRHTMELANSFLRAEKMKLLGYLNDIHLFICKFQETGFDGNPLPKPPLSMLD
ncbi:unnamed protein product [Prunus armeniaca]|uniref:Uncharacterized protein n=1 Tax=Prunus armeniaca TaxID=36596 RepID=A0A6J5XVL2_PRUAR|nr:unnamed protein product [Prunus armeniaca]